MTVRVKRSNIQELALKDMPMGNGFVTQTGDVCIRIEGSGGANSCRCFRLSPSLCTMVYDENMRVMRANIDIEWELAQ